MVGFKLEKERYGLRERGGHGHNDVNERLSKQVTGGIRRLAVEDGAWGVLYVRRLGGQVQKLVEGGQGNGRSPSFVRFPPSSSSTP